MTTNLKIRLWVIFIPLTIMGCIDKSNKALVFQQPKLNQIILEADSVRFPPEMATFPICLKLINHSNMDAILTFKSIDNEFKYQKANLYMISGKDTLLLGVKTNFIIINKHSCAPLIINGFYNFKDAKRKYFFNNIRNFPKGKIVYNVNEELLKKRDNKDLMDTVLIPTHLEVNVNNIKVVSQFSVVGSVSKQLL
jgi:hypothetical protein